MKELGIIILFGGQAERRSSRLSLIQLLIPALIAIIALNACAPVGATTQPETGGEGGTVAPIMEGGTALGFADACEELGLTGDGAEMLVMLHQRAIDICTDEMDGVVPVLSVVYLNADLPYGAPIDVPTSMIAPNYFAGELPGEIDWENFDQAVAMKALLKSPSDPLSPLENKTGSCVPVGDIAGFRRYVCERLTLGDQGNLKPNFMPDIVWETGQMDLSVRGHYLSNI